MVDITTIQTFEVLPELEVLNTKNLALSRENKLLKIALTATVILALGSFGFYLYKLRENEEI